MTRTVFLARYRDGTYFTETNSRGPIDAAKLWSTRQNAEFHLACRPDFEIIEFKLVEVKPTVKITLTSKGTDRIWTKMFPNYDFTNPLRRETLSELLLQDIKEAQRQNKSGRSGELAKLRAILRHALPRIETYDIILGGVLLGHLEFEII